MSFYIFSIYSFLKILIMCFLFFRRSVKKQVRWSARWSDCVFVPGETPLVPQCHQKRSGHHRDAAEPQLPWPQVSNTTSRNPALFTVTNRPFFSITSPTTAAFPFSFQWQNMVLQTSMFQFIRNLIRSVQSPSRLCFGKSLQATKWKLYRRHYRIRKTN